nr:hypothetical protein [Tanacetum cinerariifolium]
PMVPGLLWGRWMEGSMELWVRWWSSEKWGKWSSRNGSVIIHQEFQIYYPRLVDHSRYDKLQLHGRAFQFPFCLALNMRIPANRSSTSM